MEVDLEQQVDSRHARRKIVLFVTRIDASDIAEKVHSGAKNRLKELGSCRCRCIDTYQKKAIQERYISAV